MRTEKINNDALSIYFTAEDMSTRVAYRSALESQGYKTVQAYSNTQALWSDLDQTDVNPSALMLCLDMDQQMAGAVIRSVREKRVGKNPFIPILASSSLLGKKGIDTAMSLGADDYIARPASTADINTHVTKILETRPPFVAVRKYVGPDRRRVTNRAGIAQMVEAPNVARMLSELTDKDQIQTKIDSAWDQLCLTRTVGMVFEVGVKVRLLSQTLSKGRMDQSVRDVLDDIEDLATEAKEDLPKDTYAGAVQLLEQIVEVTHGIGKDLDNPLPAYVRLLGPLSEAICMSIRPDMGDTQVETEIAGWIKRYLEHKKKVSKPTVSPSARVLVPV